MDLRRTMNHRCTVQRRPQGSENPDGTFSTEPYATLTTGMICRWWFSIGRGDLSSPDREVIAAMSQLTAPITSDIQVNDLITDICDRRGNAVNSDRWIVSNVITRPKSRSLLVLLTSQ